MQCEDVEEVPRPCLNELDTVLNGLGMLATSTKSREEYLAEIQNKKYLNMLTINTRYVSNVSIGFRMRPVIPHVRYKPYKTKKERHRTRSENNDNEAAGFVKNVVDDCIDTALEEITQLKKAKSLESILAENGQSIDLKNCNLGKPTELEVVSNCIQNLKVAE
ncbi:hypothetical protein NQ314_015658 [Rhamnusium bicolor]|uniref:Uncharacterized protein n=1 Tax=Rhamnusium bicolor TaxID=1586634 RepID=A0AAV8WYS5_9CUCU|nr:hypothetical protein NQ314_015658 [Rhamnusium bicolor]